MDRFIDYTYSVILRALKNLKSSMDRFIECPVKAVEHLKPYLKSSMDRFIAAERNKQDEISHI